MLAKKYMNDGTINDQQFKVNHHISEYNVKYFSFSLLRNMEYDIVSFVQKSNKILGVGIFFKIINHKGPFKEQTVHKLDST